MKQIGKRSKKYFIIKHGSNAMRLVKEVWKKSERSAVRFPVVAVFFSHSLCQPHSIIESSLMLTISEARTIFCIK